MSPRRKPAAVRMIDLSAPIEALDDLHDYEGVQLFVTWRQQLLGAVALVHQGQPISAMRLRQAIADQLALKLIEPESDLSNEAIVAGFRAMSADRPIASAGDAQPLETPPAIPGDSAAVSVVVATRDRPDDLRACLRSLRNQVTHRHVEIIVVDNHSVSACTPSVLVEFPGVVLINEPRQGLSYARNAGFAASTGEYVIATDDDVVAPPHWIEQLVAPFARDDVMVVTGNVLPFELETKAQQLFELYGGLGRGFERMEFNSAWCRQYRRRALPTWQIGATANAAFRASIFGHSKIGLLDEALGAGTPTGCSEDTDLFYRVLRAGYTIVYEPSAFVWHRHRRDLPALRRQIYSYSKGHVAYHITTLVRDYDLRALYRLLVELPRAHLWQLKRWLRGWSAYPPHLIALEVLGNCAGPLALWRARRMVRRTGRSAAYRSVSQRENAAPNVNV